MAGQQEITLFTPGMYSQGVKYAKINKTDGNGNDASALLKSCQILNISYAEDNFTAVYDIISRTDKGTYYLFQLSTLNKNAFKEPFSSSIRYNWQFKAEDASFTPDTNVESTNVLGEASATTDVRGNWVIQSDKGANPIGYYENDKTTSFPVGHKYTANIDFGGVGKVSVEYQLRESSFDLNNVNSPHIIRRRDISLNVGTNIFSDTFYAPLEEGKRYTIQFMTSSNSSNGFTFNDIDFITQTYTFLTSSYHEFIPSSQSVIPEPQILNENYDYSEFNPLLNNAITDNVSSIYGMVEYDNGNIVPSNFGLIQRGAASKAEIKDYYYNLKRHTLPRYEGSKITSDGFNLMGQSGDIPAEKNNIYFSNLIGAGGQSPEYIDKTFYFTNKLIDYNGNVYNAKDPNIPQYIDYKYTFPEGSDVIVNLQATSAGHSGYQGLSGTHKVLRIGTLQTKLITGQSTGSSDYVNKVSFVNATGTEDNDVLDFRLTALRNGNVTGLGGGIDTLIFNTESLNEGEGSGNYTYSTSTGIYQFQESPSGSTITIDAYVVIKNERFTVSPTNDEVTVRIRAGGSTVATQIKNLATDTGSGGGEETFLLSFTGTFNVLQQIYVELYSNYGNKTFKSGGYLKITQNPSPGGDAEDTTFLNIVSDLGNVALGTGKFIVFSENLSNNYGLKQILSSSQTNFGYTQNIIQPFKPSPGDEIRFGYNEENAFTITKVYPPGSVGTQPSRLYVELDKVINGALLGVTRNHFLIRSYKDDNGGLTLDVKKEFSNSGDGTTKESTIRPLYVSKELENNFSNIVRELTNEGII